jgi:Eukaryotic DNA topoisomerase I, catalytic core
MKTAAYTEDTLEIVTVGLALLLAQNHIVTNPFFDEKEIKKYLTLRRQFHGDFVQACVDLADAIDSDKFGPAVKPAARGLRAIGAMNVKQTQLAMRQMARIFRGLRHLSFSEAGDPRIMRLITLARKIDISDTSRDYTPMKWLLEALVKVPAVPTQIRTLLRKILKFPAPGMGLTDAAEPGAWFDMPEDKKKNLRQLLESTEKEWDTAAQIQDSDQRVKSFQSIVRRIQKIQAIAGVNKGIIKSEQAEPLDTLLKREADLDSDGPTDFTREKLLTYIREAGIYFLTHKKPEEVKSVPRELGKVLTNLKKAKTFPTMQRCIKDAEDRQVLSRGTSEDVSVILEAANKNRAVKEGKPLAPLTYTPVTVEEFQVAHDTGEIEFDRDYTEDERKDILGKVSRAVSDLEMIYGKGFCGKHALKLAFRFNKFSGGTARAHYFTFDDRNKWQPRVTFGPDYEGVLAHELSHFMDDMLAIKFDDADPEIQERVKQHNIGRFISGNLFGNTGVPLSLHSADNKYNNREYLAKRMPELVEFVDAVLSTPDYQRWTDKLGSAFDMALPKAIANLTGVESYWDLPKDHKYYGLVDKAQYRTDLPPEVYDEAIKVYTQVAGGDDRKLSYYNSGIEIWARMCEQYVYNKLIDAGVSNPWLTQIHYEDDIFMEEKTFDAKVRPVMDRIFAKLKERKMLARIVQRYLFKAGSVATIDELRQLGLDHGVPINEQSPGCQFNWDDNDSLADLIPDSLYDPRDLPRVVLAKYKEKKEVDSINGGKTTVYVYSERQVAKRNNDKAKRLKKLSGSIKKLRSQVDKDLDSNDPEISLTALAVALMDETAERVGSEASAAGELNHEGAGHYGVTTFEKRHVSFSKGKAHLKYTGKSGVNHDKTLSNPKVVKALKKAHDACKEGGIFCYEGGKITASKVNEYLKPFDISAKDIRGFHANVGVRAMLESIRSKGGKLPEDKKEKEKKLKEEWKEAIELVAKEVGHTSSTLKNQYLTPGMEDAYLRDGTVPGLTEVK